MKGTLLLFIIASTLIRCDSSSVNERPSIEGIYVNHAQGEFSEAYDTLVIASFDAKAATYTLEERTGFSRIDKGRSQPKHYKVQNTIGVFDDRHLQLQEQRKGRIYSFTSAGDELIVGGTRYKKIR